MTSKFGFYFCLKECFGGLSNVTSKNLAYGNGKCHISDVIYIIKHHQVWNEGIQAETNNLFAEPGSSQHECIRASMIRQSFLVWGQLLLALCGKTAIQNASSCTSWLTCYWLCGAKLLSKTPARVRVGWREGDEHKRSHSKCKGGLQLPGVIAFSYKREN